jgi:hypothetical protein
MRSFGHSGLDEIKAIRRRGVALYKSEHKSHIGEKRGEQRQAGQKLKTSAPASNISQCCGRHNHRSSRGTTRPRSPRTDIEKRGNGKTVPAFLENDFPAIQREAWRRPFRSLDHTASYLQHARARSPHCSASYAQTVALWKSGRLKHDRFVLGWFFTFAFSEARASEHAHSPYSRLGSGLKKSLLMMHWDSAAEVTTHTLNVH